MRSKAEEILVTTAIRCPTSTTNVLSLPEPFMSLLLVLSHMEFKLDMEVRATPLFIPLKFAKCSSFNIFVHTHTQEFPANYNLD